MKKIFIKLILCLTMLFVISVASAQELIVTIHAQTIEAKILEVSQTEVKYKKLRNLDGPTFILGIQEIYSITYADGEVVYYNQKDTVNESSTQEDEEALALQRERERIEREQQEREAAEAAKRARQEAIDRANEIGCIFGIADSTASQGAGHQGTPVGHGNDWSLSGRSIRGNLPQPSNNFNEEGTVIVEIRVNPAGHVVSATHKGGSVKDRATIQLAIDAALRAKFTEADHDSIGTITYYFRFN